MKSQFRGAQPSLLRRTCVMFLVLAGLEAMAVANVAAQLQPIVHGRWVSRGIGGGGALFSPSISPFDSREIYMSTDMTGVFHTRNTGRSWTTLPFLQLRGGVDTHVRFTSDPDVLYAIHIGPFSERIPVRSEDGGASFVPLAGDPTAGNTFILMADPADTNRILLTGWDTLYFSSDGGQTFSIVHDSNDPNLGIHLAGAYWDGADIFAGTSKGVFKSTDGGVSFARDTTTGIPVGEALVSFAGAHQAGQVRLFGVTFPTSNVWGGIVGYEVVDSGNTPKVYRQDVGITNWTLVRDYVAGDPDKPFFLDMSLSDPDVIYLAGTNTANGAPSVIKSTDGGLTWSSIFLSANNQNIATGWCGDSGDLQWYWAEVALGFAVSPIDSERVIVTDFGFVHISEDGGMTWRQAYVTPSDENPMNMPTPQGKACRTAGVQQTSSWWIHWAGPATLVAGFSDIRGIRSTDNGLSWTAGTSHNLPHNSTYHIVEHPISGALYGATSTAHDLYQSTYLKDSRIDGADGHLVISHDDGASWSTLHDFNHAVVWLAIDPQDADTLYASVVHSSQGGIYVTRNLTDPSGPDFTRLNGPPRTEGHPLCIRILDDGSLVTSWSGRRTAGGQFTESSGVFVSTDGGTTWLDRTAPNMRRWTKDVVVDPQDAAQNTWYAGVFSHWGAPPNEVGGLYRTTDRGVTWTELADFYRVESISIDPHNPDIAYVTTETEGLWKTNDLGATQPTFYLDGRYPFQHPLRVFFNPHDRHEIWTTSFGDGLRAWKGVERAGTAIKR